LGATQININLIERNSMFRDYIHNLDLRVSRSFRLGGRYKVQAMVDIYNVLNAGTVTLLSEAFGANQATRVWMNPRPSRPAAIFGSAGSSTSDRVRAPRDGAPSCWGATAARGERDR